MKTQETQTNNKAVMTATQENCTPINMKAIILLLCIFIGVTASAQQNPFPDVELISLDGTPKSFSEVLQNDTYTAFIFWKSSNSKCIDMIESISDELTIAGINANVKLIGICIDNKGNHGYLKPMINGRNWCFENYIDPNGELKRSLGVIAEPCIVVFDKQQQPIYRFYGYCSDIKSALEEYILKHETIGSL